MLCHLLLVLPLVSLALFAVLPLPVALAVAAPLSAMSFALALTAIRTMSEPPLTGVEAMPGKQAVVMAANGAAGTVRCEGALWNCRSAEPLVPGQHVCVIAVSGLVVTVEPFPTRARGREMAAEPRR